jgi:hypothetical protein
LINVHTIHFEEPELGKGPKKICQAKDSQREVKLTTIFHHHNAYAKCNPDDQQVHCFFELQISPSKIAKAEREKTGTEG